MSPETFNHHSACSCYRRCCVNKLLCASPPHSGDWIVFWLDDHRPWSQVSDVTRCPISTLEPGLVLLFSDDCYVISSSLSSLFPLFGDFARWSMIKHFQIFNRSLSPLVYVMYLSRVQKTQLIPNKHGGNTCNRWICLPNELVDMCGLWQCGHVVTLRWWRHCVLWSHHIPASHGHSHTATAYCSVVTSIVTPGLSPVSVSSCQRDSGRRRLLPGLYPCSKCQLTFSQFRIYRIYILRHYSSPSPVTCWKL